MIFSRALGNTLHYCMESNPHVVLLGEDILDPYGGAFKVVKGLSTQFPDRVITTPISEGAISGISAGLALAGMRPIVEIMFGDFLSLCFDQITNHMAKYRPMYNEKVSCPVIIRTPSGGGRSYGPTHSQSLEKHFFGVPHLRVVAASIYHDPKFIFNDLLSSQDPVLYIEHKLIYPQNMKLPENGKSGDSIANWISTEGFLPTLSLSAVPAEDCSITLLSYGYQASLAEKVLHKLAVEDEIFVQLLVPSQITPMDWEPVIDSVNHTGRLITVEEGTGGWSWGSEAAAVIGKKCFQSLKRPIDVVSSARTIIPSSKHLEEQVLMNAEKIETAIREMAK